MAAVTVLAHSASSPVQDSRSSRSAAMAVISLCHRAIQSSAEKSVIPHYVPKTLKRRPSLKRNCFAISTSYG